MVTGDARSPPGGCGSPPTTLRLPKIPFLPFSLPFILFFPLPEPDSLIGLKGHPRGAGGIRVAILGQLRGPPEPQRGHLGGIRANQAGFDPKSDPKQPQGSRVRGQPQTVTAAAVPGLVALGGGGSGMGKQGGQCGVMG